MSQGQISGPPAPQSVYMWSSRSEAAWVRSQGGLCCLGSPYSQRPLLIPGECRWVSQEMGCVTQGDRRGRKEVRSSACHVLAYLPNTLACVSMFCGGAGGGQGAWLVDMWRPKVWDQRESQRQRKRARERERVYMCAKHNG